MHIRNFIKVISLIATLINLSLQGKTVELFDGNNEKNSELKNFTLNKKISSQIRKIPYQNSPLFLTNSSNSKKELEIQSEKQFEENNILNAEGNVHVSYKGNFLKADSIIYDKTNKIIIAQGNVLLNIGEQIFKMVSFKYDFNNKKGSLLDVKGLIKTDNLIDDLFSNFETSNIKKNKILKKIKKDKVRHTPNSVVNWILFADKIQVDGNKWTSAKAILTNDLLDLKQVNIEVNSLEVVSLNKELKFKSSVNYLILDQKIYIPFWFGNRSFTREIKYENSWKTGFDNVDKDGLYIGRKINPIKIFNDFTLALEPQFLIQRSIKGNTKSFVKKGDPITGDRVKRDTTMKDYFALNSQIKGKINKWSLEIDQQNNSFDPEKISDSIRLKTNLSKDINFLNSKWNKSFYGIYRDRLWNGSIGETEIYAGYGSKLEKQNSWVFNGISNIEVLSLGLASLKGEALNSKNLVKTSKGNLFYSLDKNFPLVADESSNTFVDSTYNYISSPINNGLSLNTKLEFLYSFYGSGNTQQYLGFGAGPEVIFGDFKKKSFDYTRISILPFYKIKSGDSMFKFDQISDKFTLGIALDQQLFGPIILKNSATLKVSRSKDNVDFLNSKISLNWKKRSYEFGIFYQPHNETGGIAFSLFGFE